MIQPKKICRPVLAALALLAVSACGQDREQAPPAGAVSAPAGNAAWKSYQCAEGLMLEARYFRENGQPAAEVRFDGQTAVLPFSGGESNEDSTAFGNGTYTWRIDKRHGDDFYKEDNGFLVRHERQEVAGEILPVDAVLVKNCAPAA